MRYCDVSLPVPLDRAFTYELPLTLRHRAQPGCRIIVPFGSRKMTGVILKLHDDPPQVTIREALLLLDEEPAISPELMALGRWISAYYCAPLGETLRVMTPLSSEIRKGKIYTVTDQGRDVVRQLSLTREDDEQTQILRLLESRPLSVGYLAKKVPDGAKHLKSLEKRGLVTREDIQESRDPLRAGAAHLSVEFIGRTEGVKLIKAERELMAYLELHPGIHNLAQVDAALAGASSAARSLARKNLLSMKIVTTAITPIELKRRHELNERQQYAVHEIRQALAAAKFQAFLLAGVTGSGKTEVYLAAIDETLALGRSALLMVPEISLTPAVAGQFFSRFGDNVAILHSAFTDTERVEQWRRIRSGAARVVVGTRSGVFAPVQNLGLIIVDEEHDQSYKQEEVPRYNGRDVAIVRARGANAVVVVGSATPSLETRYNVEREKYRLLEMPDRVESRPMPQVELIDMRAEFLESRKHATFSRRLVEAVQERLASGEQTMLLLNRRGFSSFVACRACGEKIQCTNCAVTLTYHRRDKRLLCHYCNYAEKVPDTCPKCQSEYLQFLGVGSERVEEELHQAFPKARVARLDRDTASSKRHFESILQGFREGNYDILVGTQMIAKGHDIPNVTLVGIVSADIGLGMPDFRAAERTFQLLTQAAGRAGRGSLRGRVLIQTINPEHYAVRFASLQDYGLFYEKELQFRKLMRYPPFSALANVLVRAQQQEDALRMSAEIGQFLTPAPEGMKVMGPAEAPVPRLKNEFRYQLLIKSIDRKKLNSILHNLRNFAQQKQWPATSLVIDVDPLSLL
jgi:primosomal protein N' (replication factor Y)